MHEIWQQITSLVWSIVSRPTLADIIDILIVAFLLYKLLTWTRDTRASQVLKGLGVLFVIYWLSGMMGFKALNWILNLVVNSGAVVVVVLFQSELRKALEKIGRAGSSGLDKLRTGENSGKDRNEIIVSEMVSAMLNLSRRRVGALIVIECHTGLQDVLESGTRIDAEISAPLLENIFEPNTPLHDGAVIIRGTRVEAAACILPLSENTGISRELGTRHRASLGISESTDCIALIVSEETGTISVARGGKLTRHLDAHSLRQVLEGHFSVNFTPNLLTMLLSKRKPHEKGQ